MNYYAAINNEGIVKNTFHTIATIEQIQTLTNYVVVVGNENIKVGDYSKDGGNTFIARTKAPKGNSFFDYNLEQWVFDFESAWTSIRNERNRLLNSTDWTELPTSQSTMLANEKTAYSQYRQALRDITLQMDPENIIWPKLEDYLT